MRILITNDDGADASQLPALIRACRAYGEVTAVVPRFEQSGKSHGIELHKAFLVEEKVLAPDVTVTTVDSTPADCIRYAMLGLKEKFDLVISGINKGWNIGSDQIYSGTVGAACEAVALDTPAIALSTSPEYYDQAVSHLPEIMDYVEKNDLLKIHNLYNINIPAQPKGFMITHQGGPYYSDNFKHVGNNMYLADGFCAYQNRNDLSLDTDAIMNGYISILPVTIDRTCIKVYEQLSGKAYKPLGKCFL